MRDFLEDRPSFKNLVGKYDLVGIEIGVDSGENSRRILTNLSIKRLYLIDPWCGYEGLDGHGVIGDNDNADKCLAHTEKIMEPFGGKSVIIKAKSEEVVDTFQNNFFDFIYIDGNHRYEWVIKDIRNYYPKVKVGGQLAGHDMKPGEPGVQKAVEEYFGGDYKHGPNQWDWWHTKENENGTYK